MAWSGVTVVWWLILVGWSCRSLKDLSVVFALICLFDSHHLTLSPGLLVQLGVSRFRLGWVTPLTLTASFLWDGFPQPLTFPLTSVGWIPPLSSHLVDSSMYHQPLYLFFNLLRSKVHLPKVHFFCYPSQLGWLGWVTPSFPSMKWMGNEVSKDGVSISHLIWRINLDLELGNWRV